jgi:hypothetical protein
MAIPVRRPSKKAANTPRPTASKASLSDQLMVKLLLTEKGLPLNAGT